MRQLFQIGLIVSILNSVACGDGFRGQPGQPENPQGELELPPEPEGPIYLPPNPNPLPGSDGPDPGTMYDKAELERWFSSDIPRGRDLTKGDHSLGVLPVRNQLPVKRTDGFKAIICAGAGCPIKMPFIYTNTHLVKVKNIMDEARVKSTCLDDTPECELIALKAGVVAMEMIMHDEKLEPLSWAELKAYSVDDGSDFGKRLTQDCVDQATNGISYLYIFAHMGWLKHHKIIHPGQENLMIIQPHFFTRIQSLKGAVLKFDLYHRGSFGIPPYVTCLQNCG